MRWLSSIFAGFLIVLIGCGPAGETVVITDRPDRPERTEEAAVDRAPALADTVETGEFDLGRIWTFGNLPEEYLQSTYGLDLDDTWFRRARQGALRFNAYCSGSWVSSDGLVMTNHHCGRESIAKVSEENENLLGEGFYAADLAEERRVPDLFVDQLVQTSDVTEEVYEGLDDIRTGEAGTPARIRQQQAQSLQARLTREAQERDSTLHVEVVPLYSGAQYEAYTFRRHEDVRLVMAPEMQLAFFGGGIDNNTYPRFALDVAFFRAYDAEGNPVEPATHFSWSPDGAEEGDPVFTVGSPGGTQRHTTVSQLEYQRDRQLPRQLEAMEDRMQHLEDYLAGADTVLSHAVQNMYFTLQNSLKTTRGQLAGLQDEDLMARRAAHDQNLRRYISESEERQQNYGRVFPQIDNLQRSKRAVANQLQAYTFFGNTNLEAPVLSRALYGYYLQQLRRAGASDQRLTEVRDEALAIADWPAELEEAFIIQRFHDMQEYLGSQNRTVRTVLGDHTPEELAAHLIENSALTDSERYEQLLDEGYMGSDDPSVPVAEALASQFFEASRQLNNFQLSENDLNARLGGLRYEMYNGHLAPDASGTPRLSDGVISGYEYNGTEAPYKTTFYGLYDRNYTLAHPDWELPQRWAEPPEQLDQSTPLNIVSTNDTAGGHSGSPLLNENLQVVGIVFDGNIESLANTYLYRDDQARTISVDSRGVIEALEQVYLADRLVEELRTGRLSDDAPATDQADSN